MDSSKVSETDRRDNQEIEKIILMYGLRYSIWQCGGRRRYLQLFLGQVKSFIRSRL